MFFSNLLPIVGLAAVASAEPLIDEVATAVRPFLCGATNPPAELRIATPNDASTASTSAAGGPLVVDYYAHVVTSTLKAGMYTRAQMRQQHRVMNEHYSPFGISFNLKGVDFTVNDAYSTDAADQLMKTELRRGTYADLNIYYLSDFGGPTGLLGVCYFPEAGVKNGSMEFSRDGCVVAADSIPGGSIQHYNLGGTATHEAGHWFGLFHVFQDNDCASKGDLVPDTPRQKNATSGCPAKADSCPGRPGKDNIHNYMDYSYDECYTKFTEGQRKRMRHMYAKYRAGK